MRANPVHFSGKFTIKSHDVSKSLTSWPPEGAISAHALTCLATGIAQKFQSDEIRVKLTCPNTHEIEIDPQYTVQGQFRRPVAADAVLLIEGTEAAALKADKAVLDDLMTVTTLNNVPVKFTYESGHSFSKQA